MSESYKIKLHSNWAHFQKSVQYDRKNTRSYTEALPSLQHTLTTCLSRALRMCSVHPSTTASLLWYIYVYRLSHLEIENTDPETAVALNLICVDNTTKKAIEIPIRPRPVKDLLNDVNQFRSTSHESKIQSGAVEQKARGKTKDAAISSKSGKICLLNQ